MIINRSFKEFKFRHRNRENQIIYISRKVKNDEEILNLIDNFLDEKNNIYLAKIKKFEKVNFTDDNFSDNLTKHNSNIKQSILKSYDIFLNDKYNVTLNQKTIQRVKNFFQ